MSAGKKILEEITRYKKINKYITEQASPIPLPGDDAAAPPTDLGGLVPEPPAEGQTPPVVPPTPVGPVTGETESEKVDVENDDEVEELGKNEEINLEITDLIDSQKESSEKQEEYFNNLFNQLQNLETKLADMDQLVDKLNNLEAKIEKMRPKTPEEKLELRTIDSGPFNQKLTDFFQDKEEDFQKSGKDQYVLTTDEVEEFSPKEIRDTFDEFGDEEDFRKFY